MRGDTILIVEDDVDIAGLIAHHMKAAGFSVMVAHSGIAAFEEMKKQLPDLVLLDLILPDMDGTEICKILKRKKATKDIPIIMVTAKGEEVDRIVGFELGADDYVVKPFSTREIVLRVKGVLRRAKGAKEEQKVLKHRELILDVDAHTVAIGKKRIELTRTEFKLLRELLLNKGRVRSRETLLNNVWGYTFEGYNRTVDTHIQRLRQKLGNYGKIIATVRGIGYMISPVNDEV
ncbi:MAG: response regulator transcription factor [Deltaproteobacteria bacterium]|nr:response regulator transcription factor [Deltaproteobacteria bacterium]RLB90535.1 MAG: DNA-binding response regulator [Deltaproteobacteria bacterium]RLB95662.1 MAG: DNA-binding response regulator [Deltaproteobacteria bacterium]RLC11511.1 MAG: DNA-binding response regulator [Deltaproteobacteria bacterium]